MTTSAWPEIAEELGRKSITTLSNYINQYNQGMLSDKELVLVVNVLMDAVQGLAPDEVTEVIYKVRKDIEKK